MTLSPRLVRDAIGCVVTVALLSAPALAQSVVVPGVHATTEGTSENGVPFNLALFDLPTLRYQQVYGASAFGAVTGPSLVTAITFRPESGSGGAAFGPTAMTVDIRLSTTSAAVDALSLAFGANSGANETVVYAGTLTLTSAFTGPVGGPKDFDIVIGLQNPFLYNPADGNLLLDVRQFSPVFTTQFDAAFAPDEISRISTTETGNVNDATAGVADTGGLVTRFTFGQAAAVNGPEPASLALLALGTVAGGVVVRRRKA